MGKVIHKEIEFENLTDYLKWFAQSNKETRQEGKRTILLSKNKIKVVENILKGKANAKVTKEGIVMNKPKKDKKRGRPQKVSDKQIVAVLEKGKKQKTLTQIDRKLGLSVGAHHRRIKGVASFFGLANRIKRFSQ